MKILKWALLAIVILVIAAALIVYFSLNSIVRSTVESQTEASLKLPTKLDSASLSIFGGQLSLSDLRIGSPQGYSAEHMFTLGGIDVDVSYGQLRQEPIRIESIHIDRPRLVVEQKDGKFNFEAVMENLPQETPTDGDGKREEGEPIRVIINTLRVTDATVVLRPGLPGLNEEISVPVPSFELKNIGTGEGNENGAAIKDVAMQVVAALASKAGDVGQLGEQLKTALDKGVGQIASKLSDQFKSQLGQISGSFGKSLGGAMESTTRDATKALEEGLGNLLGGRKKDDQKDGKKDE
jgi:uncharacterized protein involved in outer membrane biogenesis